MLDLYVAFGLIVAVIVVFLFSRIGVVPKKSIPIVLGAVAGVLGLGLLRRWQGRAIDSQIKELKDRIAKRDVVLDDLEKKRQVSQQELAAARASLDQQLAAAQKQRLALDAANKAEHDRIDQLDLPSTIREYQEMQEREAKAEAARKLATQPAPGGGT